MPEQVTYQQFFLEKEVFIVYGAGRTMFPFLLVIQLLPWSITENVVIHATTFSQNPSSEKMTQAPQQRRQKKKARKTFEEDKLASLNYRERIAIS